MSTTVILVVALMSCLIGALAFHRFHVLWTQFLWARRRRHGAKGEAKAEKILRRYGYSLVASQKDITAAMWIDGRKVTYQIRPDAIATKNGKRFFVEVKTGNCAGNLMYSETRRQLLEYYHSLSYDEGLFVNADTGKVHRVAFPTQHHQTWRYARWIWGFLAGIVIGGAIGKWL